MYIVNNLTSKTVILADIRAEIGPRKVLDLEMVIDRHKIDRSRDLRRAIQGKQIRIVKYSVVRVEKEHEEPKIQIIKERIIEKEKIDEERLTILIQEAVRNRSIEEKTEIEDRVSKAVSGGLKEILSSIREQLNSVKISSDADIVEDTLIDPELLANLKQKSIAKISEEIETSGGDTGKRIVIKNRRNIDDLASEL